MLQFLLLLVLFFNLTVGKAISAIGIGPEFAISSGSAWLILLLKPNAVQSLAIGLIATVIQLTTSVPGADFAAEAASSQLLLAS